MKVALVCIAKNEENYINEWIKYHIKIGFDKIFVYQNNWRLTDDIDNVVKYEIDGDVKQLDAYNNFINQHFKDFDWVAFLDVDEFLVLKKHKDVKQFVSDYSHYPAIGINWVLFGDNGLYLSTDEYSLLKRFTKRQKNVNIHIKSIVKLNYGINMNVHNPSCQWVDTDYKIHSGPFNENGNDTIAQINHYFCKTREEFKLKCDRGRADTLNHLRTMSDFNEHNFNEIEDLTAYNFFYDNNNLFNT